MRKIFYSVYLKSITSVLFILCIVFCALTVTDGVCRFSQEKERIYDFESEFSDAKFFWTLLDAPEMAVYNTYIRFYDEKNANEASDAERIRLKNQIEKTLENLYCGDKIDYYVKWNDYFFTNNATFGPENLHAYQFYKMSTREADGNITVERNNSRYYNSMYLEEIGEYTDSDVIIVCTAVKESYVKACKIVWEEQEKIVAETIGSALLYAFFALVLLGYLICVCGTDANGTQKKVWIDNIWTEIHLLLIGGASIGAILICVVLEDYCYTGRFPQAWLLKVVSFAFCLAGTVVLSSILSLVRMLKHKMFIRTCFTYRLLKWFWNMGKKTGRWISGRYKAVERITKGAANKKTAGILLSMLLIYTVSVGLLGIGTMITPLWLLAAGIVFGFACFVVLGRAKDIDEVRKGAEEIRGGNLTYKITEVRSEDLRAFAEDINEIGDGFDEALVARVKAERLKTDLVTNVSHDLKTPLTSIISYTTLLADMEDLPPEAKDYICILGKKAERLKNLTRDLFDVSKVQSGNETFISEELDAALLISQAMGEQDAEIQKSDLIFCVKTEKDLYFSADGRKMSRVFSNLIDNALKYAMPNTRVFVSAYESEGCVIFEFKNVSAYPMDFDGEEITGRFVRGDSARTDEGNGLGLAIAKSYTEACGGSLSVITDGDLFKIVLSFKINTK